MMRKFQLFVIACLSGISAYSAAPARTLDTVAGRLEGTGDATMRVRYEVLLPSADDPVAYDVHIATHPTADDPLCDSDYLIEWSLPTPSGVSSGFSAYADGHHYRYRDNRLQEYHWQWDSIPFVTAHGGVQGNAQFAELTPAALAAQLRQMRCDSTYSIKFSQDTIFDRRKADVMRATQTVGGYDCRYITWVLDPDTSLPRVIEVESNPASISEQTVTVRYTDIDTDSTVASINEEMLVARYPQVFAECRESNYAITSLPGKPLPTFSAPTPTGERYTHHRNDPMAAPTIIWLLDPSVAGTADVIDATRAALDALPLTAGAIYAFVTNNADAIDSIIECPRPGEHVLMSARSLARDCGVTAYPSAIIVDTQGTVRDVIIGVNKSLTDVVMQKMAGAI